MEGIALSDLNGNYKFVNPAFCLMTGYSEAELLTKTVFDLKAETQPSESFVESKTTKEGLPIEVILRRKDKTEFISEIIGKQIRIGGQEFVLGTVRDITERKQAEVRLRALTRTLALLSDVNQTIVRVREPQALFEAACRIAVEKGGFCMAWVGLVEPQTKQVKPVAHAGRTDGYLEKLNITLDDSERGRGPAASALRSGEHVVVNDVASDPRMAPWRADVLRLGVRASAAFPLIVAGKVCGALNLYAPEPDFFDVAELELLDEMAADIAFALEFCEHEEQRKKTDELLRASLRLSEYALSHSLDELLTKTLDEAERLTGSQIGFFHFVEADQKTLWLQSWSTNTLQKMCTAEGKGQHYPVDQAGVWVDCIRKHRPVIHNDYASLPYRKGLPQGHAPVARELVVPILRGELVVGVLGVGNKPGEYNEQDIEIVSRLANLSWEIVVARRAEDALRKSTETLQTIIQTSPLSIIVFDLQGIVSVWNQAAEAVFGWNVSEVIGKPIPFIPPDKFEEVKQVRQQLLEGKTIIGFETERMRKDGTRIQVSFSATSLYEQTDQATKVLAIISDITERKHSEKIQEAVYRIAQAADQAENLEALWPAIHAIVQDVIPVYNFYIALYDEKHDLISFPYFVDEIDVPRPPQKPGRGLTEYVLRSGLPLLADRDVFARLVQQGEVELVGVDSIDWLGVPLKIGERTIGVMAVQSYIEDIRLSQKEARMLTFVSAQVSIAIERKRMDEERFRLMQVLESSLNEIYIFDAETLKFSYANFGARKNTGYSIEQLQSMTPFDLKPEFTETSFREMIRPLLLDEMKVEVFETIHRRADGTEYPVEVHLQLVESGGVRSFLALINDISERKAAEEALHDVQTRMQHIIASSPSVLYSITPDFAANWVAQNVEFILGYTVAESLAPGWWADHLHPDDRQHVFTGLPRVFEDGKHAHEYRFQFKDGSYHWIHDELRLIRDAQGNPTEIIGAWHDVSERKQAEAELNKLREAVDTSGEVIFMTDRQGLITFVNPEFSRLYGYNADEVIGKTTPRILKGGSAKPEDYARLWQAILNRQIVKGEFTNKTRDGRLLTIEGSINPIFDEQDEIVGFLAIQRDITARKQAEIELQENEERFRRLITENADGIAVLDEAGTIIFVNPAAQTLFNRPAQELLGMPLGIPVGDSNAIVELNLPHGDQDEVNTEVRFVASQWAGQPAYIATLRDITERKRIEETIRLQSSTLAAASNSIVITDRGGTIRWVNPAFTYLTGYSLEEAIGQNPRLLKSGRQDTAFYEQVWRTILDGQMWRGEIINRRKDGSLYNEEMTITPVREAGGEITHFIAVKQDITARVQAQEDMRQRMAELEALHNISAALRVAQTRNEALPILLEETLAALETDDGVIWLYNPASDELQVAAARGWFRELGLKALKPGEGIAGGVFTSGQPYVSSEFSTDPRIHPKAHNMPTGRGGVCLPIRSGQSMVGVLFVSLAPPRQITSEQMKLLASIAQLAGSTLHRMSLHEETERRLGQLQALHNIDRAITTSMDLRMTLKILLEHVTTQLNVDAASVLLLNPHLHTLEYTAGLGFRSSAIQMAHIRLGESFAGRAALERRTIEVSDPAMLGEDTQFATMFANEGFETYYGIPLSAKGQVKGVLEIYHRSPLAPALEWLEFLETLAGQAAIAIDDMQLFDGLQRSNIELELAYDTTLEGWAKALELRDQETEGHSQRVTEMTLRLARAMGIAEAEIANVRRGALLHDMGKMGVPDSILLKPGKLTDEEWVIMRKHPQYVFDMLSPIAYLRPALDIPYCHHEKWDGTGYPRGLKGEQIPLAARIFAIIDVWDALSSDRPYRKAWTKKKTLEYIGEQSGTHFDPAVVETFLKLVSENTWKQKRHPG
ncbi:MAG: PAS domain S-box protein [Anaerolineaceae bacterium]|nr:MAG: PAS domain S-box protein [Anaerolineaceae bacterium]